MTPLTEIQKPAHLILPPLAWRYLVHSVSRGKNIMLTGPSGCGKTLAVQSVAAAMPERPFFYFNLGATQDPRSSLIGNTHFSKEVGTFVSMALFVSAIQTESAILLLDELTRAHPDAWNILMTVLDENQRYLRVDEHPDTPTIRVAPGVTFMATANIGSQYTSARVLDRALMDRFVTIIEMEPLDEQNEYELLTTKFPALKERAELDAIVAIACRTRKEVRSELARISSIISSRMTVEMAGLLLDGFTLKEIAEVSIYPFYPDAGGTESQRTYMRQLVQKYLPTTAPAALL